MNAGIGCSSSRSLFVQLHLNPDPFLPGNCETRRRTRRETIAAVINRTNIKILIKYCRRRDTTPEPLISLYRRKKNKEKWKRGGKLSTTGQTSVSRADNLEPSRSRSRSMSRVTLWKWPTPERAQRDTRNILRITTRKSRTGRKLFAGKKVIHASAREIMFGLDAIVFRNNARLWFENELFDGGR